MNMLQNLHERVLVLDDDRSIRRLLQTGLQKEGFLVDTAHEGREGLNKLLNRDYDILIVDIVMPGMNGRMFIEESMKIWPWLKVLVMTGYHTYTEDDLKKLGVKAVLYKPFEIKELLSLIEEWRDYSPTETDSAWVDSYTQFRQQLQFIRGLGEGAFVDMDFHNAIHIMSTSLRKLAPCSVLGYVGFFNGRYEVFFDVHDMVSRGYLDSMKIEMQERLYALSGHLDGLTDVDWHVEGWQLHPNGADSYQSSITVPLLFQNRLNGIIMITTPAPAMYKMPAAGYAYLAVHQMATVISTLRHIWQQAVRDPLTGTYNRRYLETEVNHRFIACKKKTHELGVVLIDLDYFKVVNDIYGHLAGDDVLIEFTRLLTRTARSGDIMGRFGGDEFIVISPDVEPAAIQEIALRIQDQVQQFQFLSRSNRVEMTCSIGVAHSDDVQNIKAYRSLFQNADKALYAAKEMGRNAVYCWRGADCPPVRIDDASMPRMHLNAASFHGGGLVEPPARLENMNIIVADYERDTIAPIERELAQKGASVATALSMPELLQQMQKPGFHVDLIVAHYRLMMAGIEKYMLSVGRLAVPPAVILIKESDAVDVASDVHEWLFDVIDQPGCHIDHLIATIKKAVRYQRLVRSNIEIEERYQAVLDQQKVALQHALEQLSTAYDSSLQMLVDILDAREPMTGQHSERVRDMSVWFGRLIGLDDAALSVLRDGAMLHDIGKVGIPDAILIKQGFLDEEERKVMQRHPRIGYNLIRSNSNLEGAAEIVLSHHEHFDGNGYPRKLYGEGICFGARIFGIIDTYDAITSDRPYSRARPASVALKEIRSHSGTQFDPELVDLFLKNWELFEAYRQSLPTVSPPAVSAVTSIA